MTVRIIIELASASPMQQALFMDPQNQDTLNALRDLVGDPTADVQVLGGVRSGLHVVQRARDLGYPIDVAVHPREPATLTSPPDRLPPLLDSED
ncbi:MAG: hypothetical protein ACJ8R9_21895 [Steroidobacteraceae bacterium]